MATTYLLFEHAAGLALFQRMQSDDIAATDKELQAALSDFQRFSSWVQLKSFMPFQSHEDAQDTCKKLTQTDIEVPNTIKTFLTQILPAKTDSYVLGVQDPALGKALNTTLGYKCVAGDAIFELFRWIRLHAPHFLAGKIQAGDLLQAHLGLAHAFSRGTVQMNEKRSDNMIIQAIAIVDQLEKDANRCAMRVKEWYGWHFPELAKVVSDNIQYCKIVQLVQDKSKISDALIPKLVEIIANEELAADIVRLGQSSMGLDFVEQDMENVMAFTKRAVSMLELKESIHNYLGDKMNDVAPNLSALLTENIGARLIAQAGSLVNLAKYPASTVQILGAEKALFRALKTKGNTPKYGLIYHSSFIGRASKENKGRISRYLANKASMSSRIDCFSNEPTRVYGTMMKDQVEERLKLLQSGEQMKMKTNLSVMEEAGAAHVAELDRKRKAETTKGGKKKKRKTVATPEAAPAAVPAAGAPEEKKKLKKRKKKLDDAAAAGTAVAATPAAPAATEAPKKKLKKKKKAAADAPAAPATPAVAAAPAAAPEAPKKKLKKKKKATA
eukprot:TRINITY_DN84244_c0_g1_i1.p1 TRINITY_DN84244_c0_g1~~TRINITY_DN84244_c0_g1_i1.p1  ORF type:complete len:556 (-),score=102.39 TRINITY_DN84244_c0_g1_i1:1945-3612(-)